MKFVDDDDDDDDCQMQYTEVKLCLFTTYYINFYGIVLRRRYSTVLKKFEAAYIKCINKCIKMFFGYDRKHSVTMTLMDLRLSTLSTIVHNATFKFHVRVFDCVNSVAQYIHYVCST